MLVAPVVDFGYYPAFVGYPGSQHLRPETFAAVLQDVIDGLIRHKAKRIAIVNTGVSTEGPVTVVVRETLERSGVRIPVANIRALGGGQPGRRADCSCGNEGTRWLGTSGLCGRLRNHRGCRR